MSFAEDMSYDAEPVCREAASQRRLVTYKEVTTSLKREHPGKYDQLPPSGGHVLPNSLWHVSNRSFEAGQFALSAVVVSQDALIPGEQFLEELRHGGDWFIPGTEEVSEVERWWKHLRRAFRRYE
ncbi:MAG: hypothetical protein AVDCRST_MAG93-8266 [uncultured Chloroflexia bacterium]|uniref:Uncharacterized protein n=1 Tax=uncultured Chloroflexia bacterium TaxID=1672391 RepID=A0A6J4MXE2_9CHLR|nr:MAG: hypothetical protein AVDCRST_MAG93-8266 [uncultured Chloroflexia bacterium]